MADDPRTVLVTGGGRGIGAGISRRFAGAGWRVLLTYVSRPDDAEAVAAYIGGRAYKCDSGNEDDIVGLFRTLDDDGVILSALVNNAGITGPKRAVADVTWEVVNELCRVNFIGPIIFCREAARRMSIAAGGRGGAIVNISSTATALGSPNQWADYAALKSAIDTFTRGFSREVGADGIRVNAVAPGYTLTDPAREAEIVGRFEGMRHEVPLDRIGTVDEVANAVYWLCSDEASYVTGSVLPAAGGR